MLSSDIRLFTWVDAEEVIEAALERPDCPDWIMWVRAYWDGLVFGVAPGQRENAIIWLGELFEPRFDRETQAVILESMPDKKRLLAVHCEETSEVPPEPKFRPSLQRPTVLSSVTVKGVSF